MWHFLYLSDVFRVGPTHPLNPVTTLNVPGPPLQGKGFPLSRGQPCSPSCAGREGQGRGIKWHNRKARRPFPVSFLAIKSQTPAEVLTPSKYTFPRPWPPLQSDLGLLSFLSGQPGPSSSFGAVWLVELEFSVDFPRLPVFVPSTRRLWFSQMYRIGHI